MGTPLRTGQRKVGEQLTGLGGQAQDPLVDTTDQLREVATTLDSLWQESLEVATGHLQMCLADASRDVHRALVTLEDRLAG